MIRCHSAHRCACITCPTCTWRHALHVSRRILASSTGPLYSSTLLTEVPSPTPVPAFRTHLRNAVDHLRRRHPQWRNFSLSLWLTRTNQLQGIAALGTLGPAEVSEKLGSRWPITLRPIEVEDLRVEIYRTLRRVWAEEVAERRYQPVSLYVGPRRVHKSPECQTVLTLGADEPMPVLIG